MKPILLALAGAAAVAAPAYAHHSFAASYFEEQRVTVEGSLVEFDFRNPHAFVKIAVVDTEGVTTEYSGEWAAAARLQAQGVQKETLKPGDHLVMTGAPARTPDQHRLHLKTLQRPADGWVWGGGGLPRGSGSRR